MKICNNNKLILFIIIIIFTILYLLNNNTYNNTYNDTYLNYNEKTDDKKDDKKDKNQMKIRNTVDPDYFNYVNKFKDGYNVGLVKTKLDLNDYMDIIYLGNPL
jgi:hypothetical protein